MPLTVAERQRRLREKLKNLEPEKYEEKKRKHAEYMRNKRKPIGQLTKTEQNRRRRQWREANERRKIKKHELPTTDRDETNDEASNETVDSTLINDRSQYTPNMLRNEMNLALGRSPSPSQPTQTTTNASDATRRSEKESQIGLIQRKLSILIEAKAQQHQVKLNILRVQQQKEEEQFKQEKLKTEQEQLKLDILKLQFQKLKES